MPTLGAQENLHSLDLCSPVGETVDTYTSLGNPGESFGFGICRITNTIGAWEMDKLGKLFQHADVVVVNWGLWAHTASSYTEQLTKIFATFTQGTIWL
jgi:hypothetical protein